ncbi:hypothetical protein QFC21_004712 [Naganishia friedmannii]|uniref:Uncharacterized protein n=1 Tax=Naganishia friedmannii TaxID=89922 RepID=A0ACC2VE47_9TREE|nr:hypothetical protein QFC21_004712 [Naganishia friedmannii]
MPPKQKYVDEGSRSEEEQQEKTWEDKSGEEQTSAKEVLPVLWKTVTLDKLTPSGWDKTLCRAKGRKQAKGALEENSMAEDRRYALDWYDVKGKKKKGEVKAPSGSTYTKFLIYNGQATLIRRIYLHVIFPNLIALIEPSLASLPTYPPTQIPGKGVDMHLYHPIKPAVVFEEGGVVNTPLWEEDKKEFRKAGWLTEDRIADRDATSIVELLKCLTDNAKFAPLASPRGPKHDENGEFVMPTEQEMHAVLAEASEFYFLLDTTWKVRMDKLIKKAINVLFTSSARPRSLTQLPKLAETNTKIKRTTLEFIPPDDVEQDQLEETLEACSTTCGADGPEFVASKKVKVYRV